MSPYLTKQSSEKEFEDFLKDYPYLIDESINEGSIQTQYPIEIAPGSRRFVDIIHFNDDLITIIELKKGKILGVDVVQLTEYVNYFRKIQPDKKIKGILVGQEIMPSELKYLQMKQFHYRELFTDIPISLKICRKCRKLVDLNLESCKWCECSIFIEF